MPSKEQEYKVFPPRESAICGIIGIDAAVKKANEKEGSQIHDGGRVIGVSPTTVEDIQKKWQTQ